MEKDKVAFPHAQLPMGEVEDDIFVVPKMDQTSPSLHIPVWNKGGESKVRSISSSSEASGLGDILVISGGSGYNGLVGSTPGATFVMPISDNGGSSSEIIRVLGGPSMGDLRSRLVRLIPLSTDPGTGMPPAPPSNDALHALLSYRLPAEGKSKDVKQEWMDILEGRHRLWRGIEVERKECVRGFLVHFESEILRRAHRNFNFRGASIGNLFLAAAQKFFRSIQSAIFLFSATTLINTTRAGRVLPVINTNHTATIAASLEDGKVVLGQCEISHPALPKQQPDSTQRSGMDTPASAIFDPFQSNILLSRLAVGSLGDGLEPSTPDYAGDVGDSDEDNDREGDTFDEVHEETFSKDVTVRVASKGRKRLGNIIFSKEAVDNSIEDRLSAKIERVFYVNAYGHEVQPAPNPEYISSLYSCRTLLYSCGSLWTSIIPCLALRGVATAITTSATLKYKVLLLNTTYDRETHGLTGLDFVKLIARSIGYCDGMETLALSQAVTHVIYSPQGSISVDASVFAREGVQCIPVNLPSDRRRFTEDDVRDALSRII